MRNLLQQIHTSALTEEEADEIMDKLWTLFHEGKWHRSDTLEEPIEMDLGMDRKEAHAARRGVPLGVLARWRYDGWPTTCAVCSKPIVLEPQQGDEHWLTIDIDKEWGLVHTPTCYHKILASRPEPEPLPPFDPTQDGKPGILRLSGEKLLEFVYESGAVQDISHSAFLYLCDAAGKWHEVDIQPDDDGNFRCYPDEEGTWHPIEWALNMKSARLGHFVIQEALRPGPPELL